MGSAKLMLKLQLSLQRDLIVRLHVIYKLWSICGDQRCPIISMHLILSRGHFDLNSLFDTDGVTSRLHTNH